jgi:hypothetical protein
MGKVLEFRTKFELELMIEMRSNGFSESEILESLSFVKENPMDEEDPTDPPPKRMKLAEVIDLPIRARPVFRKAA